MSNHFHMTDGDQGEHMLLQVVLLTPFLVVLILHIMAVVKNNHFYKKWPLHKSAALICGVLFAVVSVAGPIADRAHSDFTMHMLGHLFLGMLAPLLMVLAAPMTLLMRVLPVELARKLTNVLKSYPVRILSDPLATSLLNMGGLWILYTTDLLVAMHKSSLLFMFIHFHIFIAGYLFTMSMVTLDPMPHRPSFLYRAAVLVAALASHSILSKYIFSHPPSNVPRVQAEQGGLLMYYGGDVIDLFLIFILCYQWYKAARPRMSRDVLTH
jgi:putative membrane protein